MNTAATVRDVRFGEVLEEFGALVQRHAAFLLGALALVGVGFSAWDLLLTDKASFVPQLAFSIVGQYHLTERMLADRLPDGQGSRRYGSIFGAGLLSGLGILIGFVVLVLPGVFLISRWSIVTPLIVAENFSSTQSLSESWDRTAPSSTQLFFVYLAAGLVYLLGLGGIAGAAVAAGEVLGWGAVVATNFTATALSLLGWVLACAVYRRITPDNHGLDDVFA